MTVHTAKNMVGERKANYNVSIWKRYFRLSKHSKPGFIKKALLNITIAFEIQTGVTVYA